jgi:hypothetical protein
MVPEKPDFYQTPGYEPPKQGPGCLFWGCVISLTSLLLLIALVAGTAYFGYRWMIAKALEYTDDQPMAMPALALDEQQLQAVQQRWESFQESLDAGRAATLELTDEELNALLQTNEDVAGRIHVDIQDEQIRGRISLPLDALDIAPLRGRYFNAESTFDVSLADGRVVVRMQDARVKGRPVPEEFMAALRHENLAKNFGHSPDEAEMLRKFESIEIRHGKIIVRTRDAVSAETPADMSTP